MKFVSVRGLAAAAVVLLAERVGLVTVIGGALVVGGVALVQRESVWRH